MDVIKASFVVAIHSLWIPDDSLGPPPFFLSSPPSEFFLSSYHVLCTLSFDLPLPVFQLFPSHLSRSSSPSVVSALQPPFYLIPFFNNIAIL